MASTRTLLVLGIACVLLASLTLLAGSTGFPWIVLAALGIGATALVVGLARARGGHDDRSVSRPDQARADLYVRLAASAIALIGVTALIVALIIPEAEAQGHAIGHFLSGLLCAGLFAALAVAWRPSPATDKAQIRGMVLSLLALAAIAAFLESIGGAGYDAANETRRIEALTRLHGIVTPFGAVTLLAIPIGIATACVMLIGWVIRRIRREPV